MKIEDGLPLNPLDEAVGARVMRGAALLDEKVPGWRERVNPDTLDMSSDRNCVLGQLYDWYALGLQTLGVTTVIEATRYGFDVAYNVVQRDRTQTPALTDAWRALLTG